MDFFKKLFSESPEASFGRFASFVCLAFCMGWDTSGIVFLYWHWSALHASLADIWVPAGTLAGQISACLMWYGVNKLKAGLDDTHPDCGKK